MKKEFLDVLLPLITRINNQSNATAYVPKAFKIAAVTHILKKTNQITELLNNFCPISNLPFLSKTFEKATAKQLICYQKTPTKKKKCKVLIEKTREVALLWIHENIFPSLNKTQCVFMIKLDLSALFDMVNHQKLLDRLHATYGIQGNALNGFSPIGLAEDNLSLSRESCLKSRIKPVMFLRGPSLAPTCMRII